MFRATAKAKVDELHHARPVASVQPDEDQRINDQMEREDEVDDGGRNPNILKVNLVDDGVRDVEKDERDKNCLDDERKLVASGGRDAPGVPCL